MRAVRFAAAAFLLLVLASCGLLATSIKDIRDDPRAYDGKTVTVSGEVKSATSLLVVKFFTLADSTGEIIVITERPLPKNGQRLRVRGVVHEAFSIGNESVMVIEESGGESR
jgi:hypothetical protein